MIRIGLTMGVERKGTLDEYLIPADYLKAVNECRAVPILIPPVEDRMILDEYISSIHGIIITGGDDISPVVYGCENTGLSRNTSLVRDEAELYVIERAINAGYPILAICRGFQMINVFSGGALYQDLETEFGSGISHRNIFDNPVDLHHDVVIEKGSRLYNIIGTERFPVNSRHHQGVKETGRDLFRAAYSDDGLVEAVESDDMNIIAVQWHPENIVMLGGRYRALFTDMVERCRVFREGKGN
ncbi:MAG TPA: gamma-glutamyl-gamma-aminobutyrate hydrolase family protein [Spirochaetota bacterium]|nr:gamma-glutamyl-gamma-aminobutyrate hydrolase family protein [Spirochaetota bacterium]HPJ35222.1 gamma-glutamyl-gamma-aminobutyrate hydrolase family protein [Spirochaetota bacterium]